ncbi:hypothetical protein GGR54DRAFT_257821 [Hypoxylon sp. NC1633]|nr:hypothetical protein GGR54DRAFT_257821 [Hypoxylon sp. NC1633]
MKCIILLLVSLGLLRAFATGASIPRYFEKFPRSRPDLTSTQVQHELGRRLSNTTVIFGPTDSRYQVATSRWNDLAVPRVQVVIEPGQESDVATIVKYCKENSIEFLAINRGHGQPTSLATFNGIQINMVNLNSITIQPGGQSAWFQGGTYDGQVSDYLWERGYVATTGSCDCVGLLGAGLGGGHGRHEGLYGMVSDNMLQLNVVLGDGTPIRVNATSHSDLLWGMKGAGHNFGIVTSFEMKLYPRGPDTWHIRNYVWRGDKLEAVFKALNDLHGNGTTPVNMAINYGNFLMNTTITATEPVISWTFAYRGSAKEAQPYLNEFDAIKAVWEDSSDVPYPQVAHAQGTGLTDYICQHGSKRITTTAGLQVYNLTAERQIFDGFTKRVASNPNFAAGGGVLHEGYSTAAVDAQDPSLSAYPFRSDHHLMLFDLVVEPNNAEQERAGWVWANEVRDQWNGGQPGRPVDAYVNYANGKESIEERYGHEHWRIQKLRGLKAKYDPQNRFRFFNPIIA